MACFDFCDENNFCDECLPEQYRDAVSIEAISPVRTTGPKKGRTPTLRRETRQISEADIPRNTKTEDAHDSQQNKPKKEGYSETLDEHHTGYPAWWTRRTSRPHTNRPRKHYSPPSDPLDCYSEGLRRCRGHPWNCEGTGGQDGTDRVLEGRKGDAKD